MKKLILSTLTVITLLTSGSSVSAESNMSYNTNVYKKTKSTKSPFTRLRYKNSELNTKTIHQHEHEYQYSHTLYSYMTGHYRDIYYLVASTTSENIPESIEVFVDKDGNELDQSQFQYHGALIQRSH